MDVYFHVFLTLALDGGALLHALCALSPEKEQPVTIEQEKEWRPEAAWAFRQ